MAATANAKRAYYYTIPRKSHRLNQAGTGGPAGDNKAWVGPYVAFVSATTGLFTHTSNAGANRCYGVVNDYSENLTAVTTTDFPIECEYGHVERLALAGAAAIDVGKPLYATDSNTFTLTAAGATFVGTITAFPAAGLVDVEILRPQV